MPFSYIFLHIGIRCFHCTTCVRVFALCLFIYSQFISSFVVAVHIRCVRYSPYSHLAAFYYILLIYIFCFSLLIALLFYFLQFYYSACVVVIFDFFFIFCDNSLCLFSDSCLLFFFFITVLANSKVQWYCISCNSALNIHTMPRTPSQINSAKTNLAVPK